MNDLERLILLSRYQVALSDIKVLFSCEPIITISDNTIIINIPNNKTYTHITDSTDSEDASFEKFLQTLESIANKKI